MKTIFALTLLAAAACAAEPEGPTPLGQVVEGVYAQDGFWEANILELKGGRYRFWHVSDAKFADDTNGYPRTGNYMATGGLAMIVTTNTWIWWSTPETTNADGSLTSTKFWAGVGGAPPIGMNVQTNVSYHLNTNRWTFMKYKGQTTVWTSYALDQWEKEKKIYDYGILQPTAKKPEAIWRGP